MNDYIKTVLNKRRFVVENNGENNFGEICFNILKIDVDEVSAQDAERNSSLQLSSIRN